MKRLIPIISLLILALIFSFACTGTGLKVENTEPKSNFNIDSLIEDLKDENSITRGNAATALGNIGSPALEPLIKALEDESGYVRQCAAGALGNIGDSRAVDPLIEAILKDKNDYVQLSAAMALGSIGEPALEPLLKMLGNEDGNVRKNSALALGQIGNEKAVEPLIETLEDENILVRQNTATALGQIGDVRSLEPLIEILLKDTNRGVFQNAAIALGNIGEPAAEPLFKALEDEDNYVSIRIAMALGYIKDPNVEEFLIEALKNKELMIIAGAYNFFILRGEEGTEVILIEALNEYGNENMAEDYLNCGNGQLAKAARTWATSHGYTITQWPIGDNGKSWGTNK